MFSIFLEAVICNENLAFLVLGRGNSVIAFSSSAFLIAASPLKLFSLLIEAYLTKNLQNKNALDQINNMARFICIDLPFLVAFTSISFRVGIFVFMISDLDFVHSQSSSFEITRRTLFSSGATCPRSPSCSSCALILLPRSFLLLIHIPSCLFFFF